MIYNSYTFQDSYSAVSPLQAYFLPNDRNGEAPVLGKLPYIKDGWWNVNKILLQYFSFLIINYTLED
jgi:hypothetical protein